MRASATSRSIVSRAFAPARRQRGAPEGRAQHLLELGRRLDPGAAEGLVEQIARRAEVAGLALVGLAVAVLDLDFEDAVAGVDVAARP
jgi:hypothetical protein